MRMRDDSINQEMMINGPQGGKWDGWMDGRHDTKAKRDGTAEWERVQGWFTHTCCKTTTTSDFLLLHLLLHVLDTPKESGVAHRRKKE